LNATATPAGDRSTRAILIFWAPLALQWIMMALEGPFLAAVIARMGDAAHNLAAYGVAFAFAILVESPVIMLMSAATALVDDRTSYVRLRNFANVLNVGATGLLLIVLVPPVHDFVMLRVIGLPAEVARLVHVSLWLLLPWPAAIGYRRFLHGVLIRSGRTRLVAWGTLLRMAGMAAAALGLYAHGGLPGAWVGAAALSAGVCTEAVAARIMARGALREIFGAAHTLPHAAAPGYGDIARFYYPLALTSFIGLTVHPLLTLLMGRATAPIESLAVFPVVHALSFLFRSLAFSYQEAAIALLGRDCEHAAPVARFGAGIAFFSAAGMAAVAFTPLAGFWFATVSALPAELAAFAVTPARILVPLPALAVLFAVQQAVLVRSRTTRPISLASALEVAVIALAFPLFAWQFGMVGVSAAMLALLVGRTAGNLYLTTPVRHALARRERGRNGAA
jgi:progressive ankylosis protein